MEALGTGLSRVSLWYPSSCFTMNKMSRVSNNNELLIDRSLLPCFQLQTIGLSFSSSSHTKVIVAKCISVLGRNDEPQTTNHEPRTTNTGVWPRANKHACLASAYPGIRLRIHIAVGAYVLTKMRPRGYQESGSLGPMIRRVANWL